MFYRKEIGGIGLLVDLISLPQNLRILVKMQY